MKGAEVVEDEGGLGEVLRGVDSVSCFLVCWHLN